MEFRSTPRTDSYSQSQVFYGRRMKTDAPITAAALRMRTDLSAAESARQRVSDTKRNSANLQSTSRPDMIAVQRVSVQNPTTKRWDKRGIIVEARDPRNRTFKVKVDGTIWTSSDIFLRPVHLPLTDPASAQKGPQRSICDQTSFPPLNPPLRAPPRRSARVQERKERKAVNAILPTREDEEKIVATARGQRKRRRKGGAAAAATNLQLRSAQAMQPDHDQDTIWSGAGNSSHGTVKDAHRPVHLLTAAKQQPSILD
jgi:hypothetical protein